MNYLKELKKASKLRTALLKQSISKDETRPHLNSVWHDADLEALVSADGHIATILRSRFSDTLKGILIDPITYEIVIRDPVKLSATLPTKFAQTVIYKIEKFHYFAAAKGRPVQAHFYDDGTISIIDDLTSKTRLFTINAAFLKHLVGGTYTIGFNSELAPVAVALDGENLNNDIFIMMPLRV